MAGRLAGGVRVNFPLIHLGPYPLAFFCHNCALEVAEAFCPCCGAKLDAHDLTLESNAPAAHMAASTTGASTKGV